VCFFIILCSAQHAPALWSAAGVKEAAGIAVIARRYVLRTIGGLNSLLRSNTFGASSVGVEWGRESIGSFGPSLRFDYYFSFHSGTIVKNTRCVFDVEVIPPLSFPSSVRACSDL
jgi:hypothetical protein